MGRCWTQQIVVQEVPMALAMEADQLPRGAPSPRRRRPTAPVAVGAVGAALAVIVALDGTPVWRVARAVAVLATAGLASSMVDARGRRDPAWVAFASGCIGLAVGVGIGLPHLAKGGDAWRTSAGLTSAGSGVVLLLVGGSRLLRGARRWHRLLLAPTLLIAVAVTLLTLGQAVAATNVPRAAVGRTTPADHGLAYLDVTFDTADEVTLSGWYVPSANRAAVVLLHGAGSTRSAVLDHAVVLARHGYGVLLLDARGHGRSGGRAMDFGWYGDQDVAAAVAFLGRRPDVDPDRIGIVGLSMGGEEALGAAAAVPGLQAVVAEGATNRTAADKAWLSEAHGWRGTAQRGLDHLTYGLTDLLTSASPPIALRAAVAAAAPRPVLLIAGSDRPDEPLAARHIHSGAPGSVSVWEVPNTGHTAALDTHPEEWAARVTDFLDAALLGS